MTVTKTNFINKGRKISRGVWFYFYPILLLAILYTAYFFASEHLGHPPRVTIDDPKNIGHPTVAWLHVRGVPLLLPLPIVTLFAFIHYLRLSGTGKMRQANLHAALWIIFFYLFLIPVSWFID